ncbi:MAG: TRAP transporter small permease [Betaproteobacteria bacterium]|nr:TRAP transporter small permease [Betaproteobacteria bacterium]
MARTLERLRRAFERLLELIVIFLMVVLAAEVTLGTAYRTFGAPLVWYDEVASVLLAWLTYYGSALAALKRAHIGFPGLVAALPPAMRLPLTLLGECLVIGFFALLAWVGWQVLGVLATDTLVTLPEVSVAYTQSVIPIGAGLYILAELFNLPRVLREARGLAARDSGEGALELTH